MKLNKEQQDAVRRFFAYARERHQIYVNRVLLRKEPPWTKDPILQQYRFTNVFRELDRTTIWFRVNVRDLYSTTPSGLLATVLFRWFNRIETGETLFMQPSLFSKRTPFEEFLKTGDKQVLKSALEKQGPPYTTGSYIINTHGPLGNGYSKLDGVLNQFEAFAQRDWRKYASRLLRDNDVTLEEIHSWLMKDTLGIGDFMAYEIVSDLRWTRLASTAPDIMTWANPGLGAQRGAGRILGIGNKTTKKGKVKAKRATNQESLELMRHLLKLATVRKNWPWPKWSRWEMREVEHTLCEFDKYERTRLGMGRPRGKFEKGTLV